MFGPLCSRFAGWMQWESIEYYSLYFGPGLIDKYCEVILPPKDLPAAKRGREGNNS